MAAIARSELYDGLIRKIGYSVGLEFIVPRVTDVLNVFRMGGLDGAAWRDLVRLRWNRKSPSAEQNLADVYAQLDVIRRRNNHIQPLPGLEIMAILAGGANPLDHRDLDERTVVSFTLLLKILESDGDIFLNCLAAGFRADVLGSLLGAMIRHKRRSVAPHFPQAGSIKRLAEAISIRNQSADIKGAGARKTTYAERSRMLMSATPASPTLGWTEEEVAISPDYLEKACVTRRSWAEELGLFDRKEGMTLRGDKLLRALREAGLWEVAEGEGFFVFWPYPYQLARMNLTPQDLNAREVSAGEIAVAAAEALRSSPGPQPSPNGITREEMLALLSEALQRYRVTGPRGILRHELPLYIAEPVLAWWSIEAGREVPDLRVFVLDELKRPDRGIDEVTIRGTEGGLRLMEQGGARVVH